MGPHALSLIGFSIAQSYWGIDFGGCDVAHTILDPYGKCGECQSVRSCTSVPRWRPWSRWVMLVIESLARHCVPANSHCVFEKSGFGKLPSRYSISSGVLSLSLEPVQSIFLSASRQLNPLRRARLSSTYLLISALSVQAYWRRAQPIAFLRKNSCDPTEGSMHA